MLEKKRYKRINRTDPGGTQGERGNNMTGENFKRFNHGGTIKVIKERISKIKDEMADMQNVNNIRENGFDYDKHYKLVRQLEQQEYLLWGAVNR